RQSHSVQHLSADPVHDCEGYVGSVLRRIDMNAKWTLAEGRVHDSNDRFGDLARVRIGRNNRGKGFLNFLPIALVRAGVVFSGTGFVRGSAGMREMGRASGKRTRYNNRGLDGLEGQFTLLLIRHGVNSWCRW